MPSFHQGSGGKFKINEIEKKTKQETISASSTNNDQFLLCVIPVDLAAMDRWGMGRESTTPWLFSCKSGGFQKGYTNTSSNHQSAFLKNGHHFLTKNDI
jgi:hypothetical protein